MMNNFTKLQSIKEAIEKLEYNIGNFKQPISESRKLIQVRFKEQLDQDLESYK